MTGQSPSTTITTTTIHCQLPTVGHCAARQAGVKQPQWVGGSGA